MMVKSVISLCTTLLIIFPASSVISATADVNDVDVVDMMLNGGGGGIIGGGGGSGDGDDSSPSILNPVELVNFRLIGDDDDGSEVAASTADQERGYTNKMAKSRYDWDDTRRRNSGDNSYRRRPLPLLSRGERETEFDDFLDGEKVPSCRELRKMWKLARKIHRKALETNEIPRSSHPFSRFHSDRVRSSRRFRNRQNMKSAVSSAADSQPDQDDLQVNLDGGDKEEEIFGSVSYSPGETVKRPLDENLREVISQVRGHQVSDTKDGGAWSTNIQYFEPEKPTKQSPFDRLQNNMRISKGQKPRKPKQHNQDIWGKQVFYAKPKPTSPLEELRSSMLGGRGYRDISSSQQQSPFSFHNSFSSSDSISNARRKSLRKANRKHRKKLNHRRRKPGQRKKFRTTEFYKNLLRKAK